MKLFPRSARTARRFLVPLAGALLVAPVPAMSAAPQPDGSTVFDQDGIPDPHADVGGHGGISTQDGDFGAEIGPVPDPRRSSGTMPDDRASKPPAASPRTTSPTDLPPTDLPPIDLPTAPPVNRPRPPGTAFPPLPPAASFPPPPHWVWLPAVWRWTGTSWQWLPGQWARATD